MFKDIIESFYEFSECSECGPADNVEAMDFDTSDTPVEGPAKKPKGPPKSIPLRAMRNVQKPIPRRLPGVHDKPQNDKEKFAAARAAIGAPRHRYFESLISEARALIEARTKAQQYAGQKAMADRAGKMPFHLERPTMSRGKPISPDAGEVALNRKRMAYGLKSFGADKLKMKQIRKAVNTGKFEEERIVEGGGSRATKAARQDAALARMAPQAAASGKTKQAVRSVARAAQGSDYLQMKARNAEVHARASAEGRPAIGGKRPAGAADVPDNRERLRLRKKFGGKLF